MASRTVEGVVVSKRPVKVSGTTGVGGESGSAIGAVAGSGIGSGGRDNIVGAIGGAVVGGIAGAAIEQSSTKQSAFEYIVKSDVTGLMTIIQSDGDINVGDSVFIVLSSKPVLVKNEAKR
jgi:outer membrane lipoprotein SlyB